jgi:hypothetical protein
VSDRTNDLARLHNRLYEAYGPTSGIQFLAVIGPKLDPEVSVMNLEKALDTINHYAANPELRHSQLLSFLPLNTLFTVTL